tara:strand:- start:4572 stop:5816 length:1245 start_codon:yes stop_codon:yes gene_type:complete
MIDYNTLLDRNELKNQIINDIQNYESNKNSNKFKRGFYIYGDTGIGKTTFVHNILKELDYDVINYNASNMRNKSIIDDISSHNSSNVSVISMFNQKLKKIAIVMDEIDGMNNGDKGGISSLITLIRNKKTKRQQKELQSPNPIFCISTSETDKKIGELMKVCNIYKINNPTDTQIQKIIKFKIPDYNSNKLINLIQSDLRKLNLFLDIYQKNSNLILSDSFDKYISNKSIVENSKNIVNNLYNKNYNFYENHNVMNENDRTIVGLLWHENVSDIIDYNNNRCKLLFYNKILDNICFSDYIDRIIFQKQIWQLNELSSYIKIFFNNYLLHNNSYLKIKKNNSIRFTKVLTKYSTEFNNYTFFQCLSYKMQLDKKDIFKLFVFCRKYPQLEKTIVDNYEISELEINRIYRYIDNFY